MTASDLKEILTVCRDARLSRIVLQMGGDSIAADFAPDEIQPWADVEPGSWKGPTKLDDPAELDLPTEPRNQE